MDISLEDIVTELVVNGGFAKSKSIMAIQCAKKGLFSDADACIKEANEALLKAHQFQTHLLHEEANGNHVSNVSLVIVHGQDHLMNAITSRDLAIEMIDMYKLIHSK
ncbi:PTS lactose/cellobiose transporter subunit IIA [Vibrio gazogenes]|uniref:PTS lactose/cellobiose transporter subunit IIA n=1 Tax=Vibrio gazogenes TaxID=687 RepID=A0A1Z2SJI4_VIBGA|nr:PTS lactose/cellobiose transporter subunit IIA [Vibrio gazogenes]ASA57285.1 PTS lactose/cellobiose transporter subunit IIA [Vibrio gazogenes]